MIGKLPPQAVELEEAVLGAVLLEASALIEAAAELRPEIFYKESNKLICEAIISLYREGGQIDLLTVTEQLRKMGKLEQSGGAFYITELTEKVSGASHLQAHLKIITEKFLMREMIRISAEIQKDAFDDSTDVFELMETC